MAETIKPPSSTRWSRNFKGLLFSLTTHRSVVINNIMEAILVARERTVLSGEAFHEIVIWQVPEPVPGSVHLLKYRMALIVRGECVLRYDNERGKGDHRHVGAVEEPISFTSLDDLLAAFERDIGRIYP